jgi:poly(A) polymerase
MIKKFLQRVFNPSKQKSSKKAVGESQQNAKIISRSTHGIDRKLLSSAAIKTTEGLQKAGFEAYIVGGAVRDLLLKRRPKDFDIATDATPEQVNRVFRRSRIIGRRFRLVHVMFGDETVEVSTFRGSHLAESDHAKTAVSCATTCLAIRKKMPCDATLPPMRCITTQQAKKYWIFTMASPISKRVYCA